jgi:hypothetical protein
MKITARQEERRGRFARGELDLGDPAPPAPEAYEPFPTDVPAPQTLSDRLGRPA